MRYHILALSLLGTTAAAEVPNVVTDIAPVHSIVAGVMQGVGEPSLLIPPGASPHSYAMRPSDARALSQADVIVWVGHGLTPWLEDPLDALGPDATRFELMEDVAGMTLMPYRASDGFEGAHDHGHGHGDDHDEAKHDDHADEGHGHDDHAHEAKADEDHGHDDHAHKDEDHDDHAHAEKEHDDHAHGAEGALDPHIWLDPRNGAAAAMSVAKLLGDMDPDNADTYQANAARMSEALTRDAQEIEEMLAPARGGSFIVFHDAFHYFEARFDIEASAAVSAGDAAKPGAARIAALREEIAEKGADCAFAEPQMNTDVLATVVEGADARIATIDPIGATLTPGPDLYPQLLRNMAQAMADCLTP